MCIRDRSHAYGLSKHFLCRGGGRSRRFARNRTHIPRSPLGPVKSGKPLLAAGSTMLARSNSAAIWRIGRVRMSNLTGAWCIWSSAARMVCKKGGGWLQWREKPFAKASHFGQGCTRHQPLLQRRGKRPEFPESACRRPRSQKRRQRRGSRVSTAIMCQRVIGRLSELGMKPMKSIAKRPMRCPIFSPSWTCCAAAHSAVLPSVGPTTSFTV